MVLVAHEWYLTLPSALQTLDSLSCNGSEELEQLQLEMTDLRQEVRRLKVEPVLPADPSTGAFCWHSLVVWEGCGVACPY